MGGCVCVSSQCDVTVCVCLATVGSGGDWRPHCHLPAQLPI